MRRVGQAKARARRTPAIFVDDALLDEFEPGTAARIDALFAELRASARPAGPRAGAL